MNWRWLIARDIRRATELRKQVWVLLNSQRDLLGAKAIAEVAGALEKFTVFLRTARSDEALKQEVDQFEAVAEKWLKPYPHASTRENLKEFLVSGVLVLTIFNFFLQPMKIPSGSAQPTLYGNVTTNLQETHEAIPSWWGRVVDWFRGIDYHLWVAQADGELRIEPLTTTFGFIKRQRFSLGSDSYSILWPPDDFPRNSGLTNGASYKKGEVVLRLRVSSGDRLFVDRLTYNFRRPKRGEIIVFTSTGIPNLIQNTHYIKRLIALGGERVRVGDDRHVVINGQRLDATTPHFENVYSFSGLPRESVYSGHVNERVARESGRPVPAQLFPDGNAEYVVGTNRFLAFGDNTMNSFDGRSWGDFPREKVVGKALLVFWPITSRFGVVNR